MICFRDRTFCSSDCVNVDCNRNFGPGQRAAAIEWWGDKFGKPPVSFFDYSFGCADYIQPQPNEIKEQNAP